MTVLAYFTQDSIVNSHAVLDPAGVRPRGGRRNGRIAGGGATRVLEVVENGQQTVNHRYLYQEESMK